MKQAEKTKNRRHHRVRTDHSGFLRRLLELALAALGVTLVVEGFNQASVSRMLDYLAHHTAYFALNYLVVLTALSVAELFKRRRAMLITLSAIWIILGFSNYMVCHNRTLPLVGADLILPKGSLELVTVYFTWPQIIGGFLAALGLVIGLIAMFSRLPRRKRVNYATAVGGCAALVLLTMCINMLAVKGDALPERYTERVNNYREYGFSTCFVFSFGEHGINKPDAYSQESVEEILDEIDAPQQEQATAARFSESDVSRPNLVFVQLESFFDVNSVTDAQFSRDPTPNYHALLEQWPNGRLYVPTIGGGTANVEFEVMSGMDMDFFGAGETPYNTIMQEVTCETLPYILKDYGYTSTALHNNTGVFFTRNAVYANLGFDRFDSLEYMQGPKYTRVGWARDVVLTDEILRALDSTDSRDLVFAITVESHGKYGDTYEYRKGDVQILALPEDAYLAPFQNYVNTIPDVDLFISQLVDALENYDEPVVLVLYGDHLPGLGLSSDMLDTGDFYASHYLIWNNYGAEFEAPDMQAYRLSAELTRQLGISGGVLNKFHQTYPVDEEGDDYLEKLRMLEYDMLYGDQGAYGEAGSYQPTNLQMGITPVVADSAVLEYGRLLVTGENFTQFSTIISGDEQLDTVFIDSRHIAAKLDDEAQSELGGRVCVAQVASEGEELSRTKEIVIRKN